MMKSNQTQNHDLDQKTTEKIPAFREYNLSPATLSALDERGFTTPTPIQALTLPFTLEGRDIIGQAHTGTGKTLAFGIPIAERLDPSEKGVQAVVLTPTRELAVQVAEEMNLVLSRRGFRVVPVYGGEDIQKQLRKLERGAQVIVGTPGRFIDHLKRGTFTVSDVRVAVLDEADEMLDMGFYDDMVYVLRKMPKDRQTLFFSATMPPPIERLARTFLTNPEKVVLNAGTMTVAQTRQVFYEVNNEDRLETLCRILDSEGEWGHRRGSEGCVIIFCRTKWETDELGLRLQGRGYAAAAIHGDLNQSQRIRVMNAFKQGEIEILVATDVAARGIDISGVTHVVNYHIPPTHEDYVHRIGRTGRAGRTGMAITFVTPKEYYDLVRIQEGANVEIEQKEIPTDQAIERARRLQLAERVRCAAETGNRKEEVQLILKTLGPERAIAGLVTLLRENERELALRARLQGGPGQGTARLFMTIGKRDGVGEDTLAQMIAVTAGIEKKNILKVDLRDNYTYLEVPSPLAGEIMNALQEAPIGGRKVKIEEARPEGKKRRDGGGGRTVKKGGRTPRRRS